ncbi:hypothetical protein PHET_01994, partial [Paragonimus heterotremus]
TAEPTVSWSITPNATVQVELPPAPTVLTDIDHSSSTFTGSWKPLWRHVNESVTLLCAANRRLPGSGELITHAAHRKSDEINHTYETRWLKDGHLITHEVLTSDRISVVGSASLRIQRLQTDDSGNYQCEIVNNDSGDIMLAVAVDLLVGHAPRVYGTAGNTAVSGRIQSEKNMSCSFLGQPAPQIEWRKNTEPVQNSHFFRISSSNSSYSDLSSINPLPAGPVVHKTSLSIRGLLPNDAGYFQCFAQNRFGSAESTITLSVQQSFVSSFNSGQVTTPKLSPPSNPKILQLTETQAYLAWMPPTHQNGEPLPSLSYQIRITPVHTAHLLFVSSTLTMNTTKPVLLLTDLRPDSSYDIEVFTLRASDNERSVESASLRIRTKPMVYRPSAVTELSAESGEFRCLNISWRSPPRPNRPLSPGEEIACFIITLFNLNPMDSNLDIPTDSSQINKSIQQIIVPVRSYNAAVDWPAKMSSHDYYSHVVTNLTPDAFYQVSVQAVTANNITGHPSVISSSARVSSRPPSAPPTHVHIQSIGAHVVTVGWEPPPVIARNGELILYRINISCEDWLRPRQINVLTEHTQMIRGLSRGTKYDLTVSATTRGGNGPDSPPVSFTTMTEPNEADREATQNGGGFVMPEVSFLSYFFHLVCTLFFCSSDSTIGNSVGSGKNIPLSGIPVQSHLRSVENLRYVADERSILLLWSPPINSNLPSHTTSFSLPEVDHYVVKWGKVYPGPATVQVNADQTRFLLNKLDPDTSYLVDVSVVYKNQETGSEMVTVRTKSALFHQRLLIPLNLQVSTVESDWAMLIWDEPECGRKQSDVSAQQIDCLGKEFVRSYQVAYKLIGMSNKAKFSTNDATPESSASDGDDFWFEGDGVGIEMDDENPSHPVSDGVTQIVNATRTWARLENLRPGHRYSATVRAVGTKPHHTSQRSDTELLFSEWSLAEMFETRKRKPEDAPTDIQLIGMSLTNGSIGLQISWQPPTRPHGQLVGYLLHYTTNWTLPLAKWSRRRSPAYSVNTVLVGLLRGSIYFIQLRARNRHGNGPLSPIRLYRTPDASGQGGGEIPLGRAYYDALTIPKELLSLDLPPSSMQSKLDSSRASGDTKLADTMSFSWILIGFVTGLSLLLIAILLGIIVWRRREKRYAPVLGYKPGYHSEAAYDLNERQTKEDGHTGRKHKRLSHSRQANQDVALLVSNGEALITSDMPGQPSTSNTGGRLPADPLTNSVTLSMGVYSTNAPTAVTTAHSIRLRAQPSLNINSNTWDRDSDPLQFVTVSQQCHEDAMLEQLADCVTEELQRNQTPTRTASVSSNSCAGSFGTPTRFVVNPTYQTHAPTARFPSEQIGTHSYASATLGAPPVGPRLLLARPPVGTPSNTNGFLGQPMMMHFYHPTASIQSPHGMQFPGTITGSVPVDRRPMIPAQFFYPYNVQQPTGYPGGGMICSMDSAQNVVNPQFMPTTQQSSNIPRVNAADLMSFTSSDDIRPVMGSSIHTEGDPSEIPPPGFSKTTHLHSTAAEPEAQQYQKRQAIVVAADDGILTSPFRGPNDSMVTGSLLVTAVASGAPHSRSPKRRPVANNKHGPRPRGSPAIQSRDGVVPSDTNGHSGYQAASNGIRPDGDGDGSDLNLNKAFSTEELTQEMANLEGLMKDLSAITREEFNC